MASGGDFRYEDPDLDYKIDHDDDDDDEEEEVNTTRLFQPGAASTPYHGGGQHEMQTMQQEQSGLPETSYEETPLIRSGSISDPQKESLLRQKIKKSVDMIRGKFPKAKFDIIKIRRGTGKNLGKIIAIGTKGGEYKILKDDESDLTKSFLDAFKKKLGPRAEEIIAEDRDIIKEDRQRLAESGRQLKDTENITTEKVKLQQEIEILRKKIDQTNARYDTLIMEHGSNLEAQAEIQRLEILKKNYETDLENKKKEIAALGKLAKNKEKAQKRVDIQRAKLDEKERERNLIEERLNSTKPLDDLKEQEIELNRQNEEDQAIIQDENASPSERQAAEERVDERNEELVRLQSQIEERERSMPLRERVREIFKEYGVTVTAIFLATGVTIGAVISTITNALKSMGQQMANGLKTVGAKAASALPGLIGAIVSFLFKTAGQAIGFLAEHAWLLILAVVAFIFEKYIKRRR